MQQTLNRNSWHFWLAKKLEVVSFHSEWVENPNTHDYEEVRVLDNISLCGYVRNLLFKGFFAVVLLLMGFIACTSVILAIPEGIMYLFGWGFTPKWLSMFAQIGFIVWISATAVAAIFAIPFCIGKIKEYRNNLPKAEKPAREDGFWHMVKTVHKEKICYTLK